MIHDEDRFPHEARVERLIDYSPGLTEAQAHRQAHLEALRGHPLRAFPAAAQTASASTQTSNQTTSSTL